MAILALTQKKLKDRRRFTWEGYNGSIYVLNEGGGWGWIGISGEELIKLATRILGRPDERSRAALESYTSWIRANPYQLADLLYEADQLLSKR